MLGAVLNDCALGANRDVAFGLRYCGQRNPLVLQMATGHSGTFIPEPMTNTGHRFYWPGDDEKEETVISKL